MSKSLELSDATYDAIAARAALAGVTPQALLDMQYGPLMSPIVQPLPEGSVRDRWKHFVGCVEGKGEALAANHSAIFAEELERQHLAGKK
jgi:hypothetical protein